jgi:hypothetical protein
VRVGKAFAVDIAECVDERSKHFVSFAFAEWTVGENLPEVLVNVFHHPENQIHARKPAVAAR